MNGYFENEYFQITANLVLALAAGGIIGLERSHHGRPAGFRTHALVCLASALLMLVTVNYAKFAGMTALEGTAPIDPTRMAQGIMTGIGFLGAGVIIKEGMAVRGLTTAASIWITAAIGVLIGIGFFFAAGISTVLTLGVLSVFRWIERKMPIEFYAKLCVGFVRDARLPEEEVRSIVQRQGFVVANMNYSLASDGRVFQYDMVIHSPVRENTRRLSDAFATMASVVEFRIAPTGD
jgi:putative Mg2+ transporter-C (MgtC) family protein